MRQHCTTYSLTFYGLRTEHLERLWVQNRQLISTTQNWLCARCQRVFVDCLFSILTELSHTTSPLFADNVALR